jgi:hypothetical protein
MPPFSSLGNFSYVLNFGGSSRGFPCNIRVPPFRGFVPVTGHKPVLRASTALVDLVLLVVEVSMSHSDTPHSLGHLWTSDRTVADTSDNTLHLQETDIHDPGGIRTRKPNKRLRETHAVERAATGVAPKPCSSE